MACFLAVYASHPPVARRMATLTSGLSARLWPGGTYTRWIPSRSFTASSSVPPLPSFPQRDNNVGAVRFFSSVLIRALRGARHFALVRRSAISNQRLARNRFRCGTQSDPSISSVAYAIMIPSSNSSVKEERAAQSITRCSIAHHRLFRACPRVSLGLRPAKSHEN